MRNSIPIERVRGPTSDEFAHDANATGPLQNLRKRLDAFGADGAPYTEDETAIVFVWLPPMRSWDEDDLAAARPEIEQFSREPETARQFIAERLSSPFAAAMRDHLDGFAAALPSWFRRVNAPAPSAERVVVLQAAVLRLYDLAVLPAEHVAPSPESLPAAWRRNAS